MRHVLCIQLACLHSWDFKWLCSVSLYFFHTSKTLERSKASRLQPLEKDKFKTPGYTHALFQLSIEKVSKKPLPLFCFFSFFLFFAENGNNSTQARLARVIAPKCQVLHDSDRHNVFFLHVCRGCFCAEVV